MNIPINTVITNLRPASACGCRYKGWVDLFGASHHVDMVRVADPDGRDADGYFDVHPDADYDVRQVFDDMQAYSDGPYQTVTVPDVEGRWVVFIHPFGS